MSDGLMFPKGEKRKKRIKHKKSIMHSKSSGMCYLCVKMHGDCRRHKYLEEHHVMFGKGQRTLSKKYGLEVYLCEPHHRSGPEAPHNNQKVREMLCRDAQIAFSKQKDCENLNWSDIFEKNYLEETEE